MGLKKYKPTTPGRRFVTLVDRSEITKQTPEKSLTRTKKENAGRNNTGRVTCRHRGGGHKRRLRDVDFLRTKDGVEAKVVAIEYDPNRTARIALLHYTDGIKAYVLATKNMRVGDRIASGQGIDVTEGNCLPLFLKGGCAEPCSIWECSDTSALTLPFYPASSASLSSILSWQETTPW